MAHASMLPRTSHAHAAASSSRPKPNPPKPPTKNKKSFDVCRAWQRFPTKFRAQTRSARPLYGGVFFPSTRSLTSEYSGTTPSGATPPDRLRLSGRMSGNVPECRGLLVSTKRTHDTPEKIGRRHEQIAHFTQYFDVFIVKRRGARGLKGGYWEVKSPQPLARPDVVATQHTRAKKEPATPTHGRRRYPPFSLSNQWCGEVSFSVLPRGFTPRRFAINHHATSSTPISYLPPLGVLSPKKSAVALDRVPG